MIKVLNLLALLVLVESPAIAETLVPVATIQPGQLVTQHDFRVSEGTVHGALTSSEGVIGLEARRALYAGRPVTARDFGPPAVIERNQIVRLVYQIGVMSIVAEGRALDRAAAGDTLRVMNISSRTTVSGRASSSGSVQVNQGE